MPKDRIFMVRESFIGSLDGVEVEYHQGEIVEADDPALGKWPDKFGPLVFKHHQRSASAVEQATRAPGEKRGG